MDAQANVTAPAPPATGMRPWVSIWSAPLVPVALAFTAGIVLDRYLGIPILFGLVAAIGGLVAWLAAAMGRRSSLPVLYLAIAVFIGTSSLLLPFPAALAALFLAMACLGMGNGVIFQVVPQRFRQEIGTTSGLVGAAGGLGGFLLPSVLGLFKDLSGTYATGFAIFAAVCVLVTPVVMMFWRPGLPHMVPRI